MHNFKYKWYLKNDYPEIKNNLKVFGTFVCAGGSTMGYKLAGYDHIGGVELTEHYSKIYVKNHNPKFMFTQDIREFNLRNDLPDELYNLDLLDGSPPCSSFSTSGAREKLWGKEKKYENKNQKTDDLIFEYCNTIEKLKPKTFIMENVRGLILGNAQAYLKELLIRIDSIGYNSQVFSLNAASMGVPQMRQRVFVIGHKKELKFNKLVLEFNEKPISFKEATHEFWSIDQYSLEKYSIGKLWNQIKPGQAHPKRFNLIKPSLDRPCYTQIETASKTGSACCVHPIHKRHLNDKEASVIQSFPLDFDFLDKKPLSAIGRSVPPVMMAQISSQVYKQWFIKR